MTSHPTSTPALRAGQWLAFLALLIGFVWWDASIRSRHLLGLTSSFGVTVDAPAQDQRSPTGYVDGRRTLIIPAGSADTAHWIMQTQSMLHGGETRIRHVEYDNAPRGREVHWAIPYRAWLATLAWLDASLSGRPLGASVERAALVAGPIMLTLILLGLVPFIARNVSKTGAVFAGAGAIAAFPFYVDFLPGRADHHGLVNTCALLTVLFIGASHRETARRWFVASALAGGLGMWLSAATLTPVLVGLGLGVLVAAVLGRGSPHAHAWLGEPTLFRLWGWIGGAVSLAAYVLEYFPSHLGMRLEVNHPLYSLAWAGGGEAIALLVRLIRDGKRGVPVQDLARGLAGAALVFVLPITIAATRATTFAVSDPLVWSIHSLHISEIQGLLHHFSAKVQSQWVGIALPSLLLIPPLLRILSGSTTRESRAALTLVWVPATLAWALGWAQVRWLGLSFASSVPLLAVYFQQLEADPKNRRSRLIWTATMALFLVPGAINAFGRMAASREVTRDELRSLAERDVAHWLRLRAGTQRTIVASGPSPTTLLAYYGNHSGLGTLFWENGEGMKNATEFFGTPSEETARELAQRLGITHVVFFSWSALEVELAKLHRGVPKSGSIPADSFVARLLSSPVPPTWLRELYFRVPENPALAGAYVRIWEVGTNRSPARAIADAASFYLESGRANLAARLIPGLIRYDNDPAAMSMLAGITSRQGDASGFEASFARMLELLPSATDLTAEEHLRIAVVLTVGKRIELARHQVTSCMSKLDETRVRRLTTGSLTDLLALSEAFHISFPSPELQTLAKRLVPPTQRK